MFDSKCAISVTCKAALVEECLKDARAVAKSAGKKLPWLECNHFEEFSFVLNSHYVTKQHSSQDENFPAKTMFIRVSVRSLVPRPASWHRYQGSSQTLQVLPPSPEGQYVG
jgi:hypothetical protein